MKRKIIYNIYYWPVLYNLNHVLARNFLKTYFVATQPILLVRQWLWLQLLWYFQKCYWHSPDQLKLKTLIRLRKQPCIRVKSVPEFSKRTKQKERCHFMEGSRRPTCHANILVAVYTPPLPLSIYHNGKEQGLKLMKDVLVRETQSWEWYDQKNKDYDRSLRAVSTYRVKRV